MLAVASRRREEALAAWYGRRRNTVLLAAGITLLVIVTTWMLNRSLRALRRRELHYRTLFNNAAFGAFVLEGERIIEANRTSATMFGIDHPSVLIGMRLWDLSPATQPDGTSSEELCRERIRHTIDSSAASFEWIHQRLDTAAPFHAAVDLSSLDADGKTLTLAVIHDVSERKLIDAERERVLDELHELAATLVHIQDDERRRIGRDLHDSTGQALVALELSLTRLARAVEPPSNSARALVDDCVTLARQCSTEIRTASYLLHPPLLDEIGLLSALRWLADGLRQRSGIKIELELPESMERLPPEHELAIFRVAQEALTNVHRHSKSPSVIDSFVRAGRRCDPGGRGRRPWHSGRRLIRQGDGCRRAGRRPGRHARANAPARGIAERAHRPAGNLCAGKAALLTRSAPSAPHEQCSNSDCRRSRADPPRARLGAGGAAGLDHRGRSRRRAPSLRTGRPPAPDIAVLDLTMPELNGLDVTREFRASTPKTRILIVTAHESEQLIRDVLDAGAMGYVLKSDAGRVLVQAIEALLDERPFFTSKVARFVLDGYLRSGENSVTQAAVALSPRERQIVQLLAEGNNNKEVARACI